MRSFTATRRVFDDMIVPTSLIGCSVTRINKTPMIGVYFFIFTFIIIYVSETKNASLLFPFETSRARRKQYCIYQKELKYSIYVCKK